MNGPRVKALDHCDSRLDAVAYKTTIYTFEVCRAALTSVIRAIGAIANLRVDVAENLHNDT